MSFSAHGTIQCPGHQSYTPSFCRIFARVSLSYGKGPRSAALDLLLYDSLCWECGSSGECKAKTKETTCFFAAGTSTIQDFRIGRTISTRVSPGNSVKILILFHEFADLNQSR